MENNTDKALIKPADTQLTTTDNIHVPPEDRVTVSKSKLEHLKDLADDDRFQESSTWSFDRILSTIGLGLFFAALGNMPNFRNLNDIYFWVCICVMIISAVIAIYAIARESQEERKKKKFRSKLSALLGKILAHLTTT